MATSSREKIARKLLRGTAIEHPEHLAHHAHRQIRVPALSPEVLMQKEIGWNDRFHMATPSKPRTERGPAPDPYPGPISATSRKQKKIKQERSQYGPGDYTNRLVKAKNGKKISQNGRLLPIDASFTPVGSEFDFKPRITKLIFPFYTPFRDKKVPPKKKK